MGEQAILVYYSITSRATTKNIWNVCVCSYYIIYTEKNYICVSLYGVVIRDTCQKYTTDSLRKPKLIL